MRIDDVTVGARVRRDLGDVAGLAASIAEVGLLHPIVVTPDKRLIAGERRIEACRVLLGFEKQYRHRYRSFSAVRLSRGAQSPPSGPSSCMGGKWSLAPMASLTRVWCVGDAVDIVLKSPHQPSTLKRNECPVLALYC